MVYRTDNTLYNIVDVSEVTAMIPEIVYVDRFSLDNILRKEEESHIRTTERTINGKKAQSRRRQIV